MGANDNEQLPLTTEVFVAIFGALFAHKDFR